VIIVTEVPGNPSFSVTNGMSRIVHHVRRQFDLPTDAEVTVYQIWPKGAHGDRHSSAMRVPQAKGRAFQKATRREIETLLGIPLHKLPPHPDLHKKVLELGGGVIEEISEPIFEALPVTQLPPPHCPYSCEHFERFQAMDAAAQVKGGGRRETEEELGLRFWGSLAPDDLLMCRYHQADWRTIADLSVAILEDTGGDSSHFNYSERAGTIGNLSEAERGWLISLFTNPIIISEDGYTNGQHRACALRFSGAKRGVVVTGDRLLGEQCTDWTFEGEW
jgi:hypothetical protein